MSPCVFVNKLIFGRIHLFIPVFRYLFPLGPLTLKTGAIVCVEKNEPYGCWVCDVGSCMFVCQLVFRGFIRTPLPLVFYRACMLIFSRYGTRK